MKTSTGKGFLLCRFADFEQDVWSLYKLGDQAGQVNWLATSAYSACSVCALTLWLHSNQHIELLWYHAGLQTLSRMFGVYTSFSLVIRWASQLAGHLWMKCIGYTVSCCLSRHAMLWVYCFKACYAVALWLQGMLCCGFVC